MRNPQSTRPYQHVLEPLYVYLLIAQAQYEESSYAGWYNVGPDECDCVTTGELCDIFCQAWGEKIEWHDTSIPGPHEARFLKIDCSKIKDKFGWRPRWHIDKAVEKTVEWAKAWQNDQPVAGLMDAQIEEFLRGDKV